jgi:DNA polymerase I-like protein with 3'-5' exonuclease and polymerase domains
LEELARQHQLPALVLEYRTLYPVMHNFIKQLEAPQAFVPSLGQYRLLTEVDYRTATGRLKFCRPSLQTLPKAVTVRVCVA